MKVKSEIEVTQSCLTLSALAVKVNISSTLKSIPSVDNSIGVIFSSSVEQDIKQITIETSNVNLLIIVLCIM